MKISNGVKNITILAIETSCDDTCAAIVQAPKFKILSNIVSSQKEIHKKWGGVYPSLAKREHQKNLPIIIEKTLRSLAPLKGAKLLNLIAVTVGPGLEPCLWVGINFAKSLAHKLNVPIVPVNHIEAHILVNFIDKNQKGTSSACGQAKIKNQNENVKFKKKFPAVCLVVSGGHTQLILMRGIGKYKILGETRDDAAGECFDKTARILGLGYPGGPAIAREAKKVRPPSANGGQTSVSLPRPMLNQKNYDFSFSGLKTAVLYASKRSLAPRKELSSFKKAMAKEIQQAIIDVLIKKTIKAAKDYKVKTIILGGGVAANSELRKQFKKKFNNVILPPKNFCIDNAVMTAIAGYYHKKDARSWKKIKADANLKIC